MRVGDQRHDPLERSTDLDGPSQVARLGGDPREPRERVALGSGVTTAPGQLECFGEMSACVGDALDLPRHHPDPCEPAGGEHVVAHSRRQIAVALLQIPETADLARVVVTLRPLDDRLDQESISSSAVNGEGVLVIGREEVVCGAVLPVRLGEGIPIEGLASGTPEVVDGFDDVAAALIVVRERLDELGRPSTELRLDAPCDSLVQRLTIATQQTVVRDLLRERVLEDVLELGVDVPLVDEVGGRQPGKAPLQILGASVTDCMIR